MDIAVIPLDEGMRDADELSGDSPAFVNALVIGAPGKRRPLRTRPGIRAWSDAPATWPSTSPVVAMCIVNGVLLYVTDDGSGTRDVFHADGAGLVTPLSSDAASRVAGTAQVFLAVGRDVAIATGGAEPQKIAPGVSARLGGSPDAPPHASMAAFIAQRLVLVPPDSGGNFFWSDVGAGGIETWDTLFEFREAEARPDRIVGCMESSRELFMFGASTTQMFTPDPDEIYAPVHTSETGCLAAGSIMRVGQVMACLDDRRRIILTDARSETDISSRGIAAALESLTDPTDVWCFRAKMGHHDLLTWVFRADGRAFSFDRVSETWSEWRRWSAGRWQPWAPLSHVWWPERKLHLVGMPDGSIAELSLDAHSDLTDPLKWQARTGFMEAPGRRHPVETRFTVRRGEAASSTSEVSVSWRNDLGDFCAPISTTLGTTEKQPEIVISPAGEPYRRRQYELSGDGADAYLVSGGSEIYEEAEF